MNLDREEIGAYGDATNLSDIFAGNGNNSDTECLMNNGCTRVGI